MQNSESFSNSRSEKLESYLRPAYGLLRDILAAWHGKPPVVNRDVTPRIAAIAQTVSFSWIERASAQVDELVLMVRRNIQKTAALDAFIMNLRNASAALNT